MDDAWKREFARKIGRRLRAARQLRGMGDEELAARSGIPARRLKRYEAELRQRLLLLAKAKRILDELE